MGLISRVSSRTYRVENIEFDKEQREKGALEAPAT